MRRIPQRLRNPCLPQIRSHIRADRPRRGLPRLRLRHRLQDETAFHLHQHSRVLHHLAIRQRESSSLLRDTILRTSFHGQHGAGRPSEECRVPFTDCRHAFHHGGDLTRGFKDPLWQWGAARVRNGQEC